MAGEIEFRFYPVNYYIRVSAESKIASNGVHYALCFVLYVVAIYLFIALTYFVEPVFIGPFIFHVSLIGLQEKLLDLNVLSKPKSILPHLSQLQKAVT